MLDKSKYIYIWYLQSMSFNANKQVEYVSAFLLYIFLLVFKQQSELQ